ncbi:MAG: hypothetical protein ABW250_02240 [Pyrinomonadaceae bacterium]
MTLTASPPEAEDLYTRESKLSFAVYAYATSVLARGRRGRVTRDEAEAMLRALAGDEAGTTFFGGGGVAALMLGAAELFFEYDAARGSLSCGALVYRFRKAPRQGVLQTFFEEAGAAGAGGGALVYREETRSLLISRTYFEEVNGEEFAREMKRLAAASLGWGAELLERVASRHERVAWDEGGVGV